MFESRMDKEHEMTSYYLKQEEKKKANKRANEWSL